MSIGERLAALEVEVLAGLLLELDEPAVLGNQLRGDVRVDPDQERLRLGLLGGELAQLADDLDRHRLRGADDALAVAGRAALVRISRTPSVTFWRVISTRPSGETSMT